jgi:hypothetical protein
MERLGQGHPRARHGKGRDLSAMTKDIQTFGDDVGVLSCIPAFPHKQQDIGGFSSPEAFARYLEALPESSFWRNERGRIDVSFTGATFKQACAMLRDGWQEGAARVAALRDKINIARPHAMRLTRYSVAGSFPNVPRYLAGDPCNMLTKTRSVARTRPVITLVANMTGSCTLPKEVFINKAAVTAAVIDAIEEGGFSVHLIAIGPTEGGNNYTTTPVITVKAAGEHLDVARVAFALGHVAMFRAIVFTWICSCRRAKPMGEGLGNPIELARGDDASVYILPNNNSTRKQFASEASAATDGLAVIIKSLREQGCPAFEE